jgi:hypothetical protein
MKINIEGKRRRSRPKNRCLGLENVENLDE